MNYSTIMRDVMDVWAKSIKEHSHDFLARLLKPAFIAAYHAGAMDQSTGKLDDERALKAGFQAVRDYFNPTKKVIKVHRKAKV